MVRLIKQVFAALLSFCGSLLGTANVCDQQCMTAPTIIDLNLKKYNKDWFC